MQVYANRGLCVGSCGLNTVAFAGWDFPFLFFKVGKKHISPLPVCYEECRKILLSYFSTYYPLRTSEVILIIYHIHISAAYVGVPVWSLTTCKESFSLASLIMVFAKLFPKENILSYLI